MKTILRISTIVIFSFFGFKKSQAQTFQYDWANVYGSSASYYYSYTYNCGSWSYPSYCTGYSYRYAQNEIKSSFYNASGNIVLGGNYIGEFDADPGTGTTLLPGDNTLQNRYAYFGNYDAAGNMLWAKSITGNVDFINTGADAAGNIYIVLNYAGTIDADPSSGIVNFSSNSGSWDLFIGKYTSSGSFLWGKSLGGTSTDYIQSAAIDASGNIYLGGYYYASFDADAGAGTTMLPVPAGGNDAFVIKYSAAGTFSWAKAVAGNNYEYINSMAVNAAGELYLGGYFNGTIDADPGAAVVSYASSGSNNGFIIKLNSSGIYTWSRQLTGSNNNLQNLNVDASGNLVTTGNFNTSVDLDPVTAAGTLTTSGSWISKYDPNGNYVWGNRLDQINNGNVKCGSSDKIFMTGAISQSTFDADPGTGTVPLSGYGSYDILFAVYNSDGTYQNAFREGSANQDYPYTISVFRS
jgi:hypothetical protein